MLVMFNNPCGTPRHTKFSTVWRLSSSCSYIITKVGKGFTSLGVNSRHGIVDKTCQSTIYTHGTATNCTFIVIEGPDSAGKTFHSEGISLWLTKQGFAVQGLTFPQ